MSTYVSMCMSVYMCIYLDIYHLSLFNVILPIGKENDYKIF